MMNNETTEATSAAALKDTLSAAASKLEVAALSLARATNDYENAPVLAVEFPEYCRALQDKQRAASKRLLAAATTYAKALAAYEAAGAATL